MRAIVAREGKVALETLPKPEAEGDDDIIIRVRMVGLCRTDMYVAQGLIAASSCIIPGHEFCGDVIAVGHAVKHVRPGQRVGVMPVRTDPDGNCIALGKDEHGAFAEYVRVKSSQVYALPDTMDDRKAAYLEPVAASLAVLRAPISPHMHGTVYGDNRIAALTCAILRDAGFGSVTTCTDIPEPDSYDFIVETQATPETLEIIVRALKPGGILILKSRPYTPVALPLTRLVEKELRVTGVHYAAFTEAIAWMDQSAIPVEGMFGDTGTFEDAALILSGAKIADEQRKLFFRP